MKLGNNRWETAKFNERAQLTEIGIGVGVSDNSVWKLEYKYGELESGSVNASKNTGNIARSVMTLAGVTNPIVQNYKYDSLYRLTEAEETAGATQNWIQQFQYDRFGNRTAFSQTLSKTSGAVQTTTTPVIDQATNRFVTANQNFRYDKNGNLTTDGDNREVIFNGENKQYEVKNAAGQTIGRYFYDGEGKRVKKITWNSEGASETTIFVYSAGKLVAEYSNTQVPVPNRTTRYLTEDHLGTPRVITDSQGNVISRRDFLPFGEEITPDIGSRASVAAYQPTNDNVKQKFTGYQKDDETGLDFAEARMYENRHGRFTAVDPLLASGKSAIPQTFNRYIYCLNNPINCVDPDGLDGVWAYRDIGGGTQVEYFESQAALDSFNKNIKDKGCEAIGCVEYQVWSGGSYFLWEHGTVSFLGSTGDRYDFQFSHPDDRVIDAPLWNEIVRAWRDQSLTADQTSVLSGRMNREKQLVKMGEQLETFVDGCSS